MKIRLWTMVLALSCAFSALAADDAAVEGVSPIPKSPPLSRGPLFSLVTEGAYYFSSEHISSDSAHFSPLDGIYDGVQARTTLLCDYRLATPLGEHWLLNGASLNFRGGIELTPVTITPSAEVSFMPLPFIVLSAGASAGTGWQFFSFTGLAELNAQKREYDTLRAFSRLYYEFWASGTLMFDLGAVVKSDWAHVVLLASCKVSYSALSGFSSGEIWKWQNEPGCANGFQYEANVILGYQLPFKVHRVGVLAEFNGHFDSGDYGVYADSYKGDFMTVLLSPFVQIHLTKVDELSVAAQIASRRSFKQPYTDEDGELFLDYSSYEWHFNRIGVSWHHRF